MKKNMIYFLVLSIFWLLFAIINPDLFLPLDKKKLEINNPTNIAIGSNQRLWSFSHNGTKYRILCSFTQNENGDYFCDWAYKRNLEVKNINIIYFDNPLLSSKNKELVMVEKINFHGSGVVNFNIPHNQIIYWEDKLLLNRMWFFYCFFVASYVGLILYLIQNKIKNIFLKLKLGKI